MSKRTTKRAESADGEATPSVPSEVLAPPSEVAEKVDAELSAGVTVTDEHVLIFSEASTLRPKERDRRRGELRAALKRAGNKATPVFVPAGQSFETVLRADLGWVPAGEEDGLREELRVARLRTAELELEFRSTRRGG